MVPPIRGSGGKRNKMQKTLLLFLLCLSANITTAQVGGLHIYEFLNLPASSRVTALGGSLITVYDDDVNLAYHNPAVTNKEMHKALSFSNNFFLSDINHGYFGYGHHLNKLDVSLHGGVQYIDYGTFDRTDITGTSDGTFSAGEYAFTVGAAKELYEKLSVGANVKWISSGLENYSSMGLVGDVAAFYKDTASRFTATIVMKNIGGQLSTYNEVREDVPYEVQVGVSKRLKHLPFRFSVIYKMLNRWDIRYDDPNAESPSFIIGDQPEEENQFLWVDNFFRHLVFNGEFLIGKKENFRLRLGYNHFQQREMKVRQFRNFAGFTYGLGLKIKGFRLDYGRGIWHIAGSVNHVTISTNLQRFGI